MQLICPLCRTPLPALGATAPRDVLTCQQCAAEVDVSRAGTGAGRPRFLAEIDRTGQTIGGFVLEARIGAGGMGTVYRGRRSAAAAPVAVKLLTPALAAEPDVALRFRREMEMLRRLDHPAIVRLMDHGTSDGVPWFAMELVEGTDLRARLGQGALAPAELHTIFALLLDALDHAHGHGVVHRDIKPGNVLLATGGAKLADFGVALPVDPTVAAATRLTETAAIVGTLPYMSPEQRAGRPLDRRSDLFSVGVVLYEAATGALPQGAFPPPSRINRSLPAAFDRVVLRLLQPDPAARFATAAEAAKALAAALGTRAPIRRLVLVGGMTTVATSAALLAISLALWGGRNTGSTDTSTLQTFVPPVAGIAVKSAPRLMPPPVPLPQAGPPREATGEQKTAPSSGKTPSPLPARAAQQVTPKSKTAAFAGKKAPKLIAGDDLSLPAVPVKTSKVAPEKPAFQSLP